MGKWDLPQTWSNFKVEREGRHVLGEVGDGMRQIEAHLTRVSMKLDRERTKGTQLGMLTKNSPMNMSF